MLRSSSNRGFLSAGLDNSRYLGGEGDKGEMREKRRVVRKGERGREEEGRGRKRGREKIEGGDLKGERGREEEGRGRKRGREEIEGGDQGGERKEGNKRRGNGEW